MSKRRSAIDNNRRSSKRRKIEKNYEVNDANSESMLVEAPPVFDMANLPLEILGNLIFKYFDFKYWLRSLTRVNKQWRQAAIQSNVDKQLFINSTNKLQNHCFIAARYKVTTIVLKVKQVSFIRLTGLLSSSPKLHTFVYTNKIYMDGCPTQSKLKFPFIKTAMVHSSFLERFPNATRVQLLGGLPAGTFPNVEELAIQETRDVNALLKQFPSLKVLHVYSLTDDTLKTNPPTVELRITSIANNRDWYKYYSFNQAWDKIVVNSLLQHSVDCKYTKYTAENPHPSIEYEISLLDRNEEYTFPAIAKDKLAIFKPRSTQPADEYCKRLNLDSELAWYLSMQQKEDTIQLLKENSHTLSETMKPARFVELLKLVSASTMKKCFTKDQLADMMKLCNRHETVVNHFIRLGLAPKDLDQAIKNFGPLPDDWQKDEYRFSDTLVEMAGRAARYDWIEYLIFNDAKVNISTFFSNFYYEDDKGIEHDTYNTAEVQYLIRLIHTKNAYRWDSDWLYSLDWNWKPTRYQIEVLDFLVEEFEINLNSWKHVDEENNDRGTSFMNFIIEDMEGVTNLELIEHIWRKYNINLDEVDNNDRTPLLTAIISHSMSDLAIWLLEKGVATNMPKSDLPLCRVIEDCKGADHIYSDIYTFIDMLLAYGADINEFCVDEDNKPTVTALMMAAKKQPVDIVKYLVMRGAKVALEDVNGYIAIHYAIDADRSEAVEFLAKCVDVNTLNEDGLPLLHAAIKSERSLATVKALLKNGADVNQVEPDTLKTPAMMACVESDFALLEEILKYNVDIRARDKKGHSLVYYIVKEFYSDHDFLSKAIFLDRIKHLATDDNIAFVIAEAKKIIKRAIKTASQNYFLDNIFALCTSTQYFAEFLIDHVGFDINTQDDQGNVLLSYPMNEETFMYLMTKNPNVNIKNNEGKTPLKVLKQRDDEKLSQKMLDVLIKRSNETSETKHRGRRKTQQ